MFARSRSPLPACAAGFIFSLSEALCGSSLQYRLYPVNGNSGQGAQGKQGGFEGGANDHSASVNA